MLLSVVLLDKLLLEGDLESDINKSSLRTYLIVSEVISLPMSSTIAFFAFLIAFTLVSTADVKTLF